ncbi:MAG: IS3 family transposase [Acidimicrobiia bacterium]|nr:IS3 family transposase [Acidimicrobiia bacterium]
MIWTWSLQVGHSRAAEAFGVPARTWRYRRNHPPAPPEREPIRRRAHPAALTEAERQHVLDVLHEPRFCDLAPLQVYAQLLDEGRYLCSERSMYRILEAAGENPGDRRNQRTHPPRPVPRLEATGPNQCWSWDITFLYGPRRRKWQLYVVLDIFSRYVVGWTLTERESEAVARRLLRDCYLKQNISRDALTVHADRGAAMTAKSVAQLLEDLAVTRSHSRPRVSNDNPYSEAQFKTLKYRPDFPGHFDTIQEARAFCRRFFRWYNEAHYHSAIGLMHPFDVHHRLADTIRERRQAVLDAAYDAHPERFRTPPVAPLLPTVAWINQPTVKTTITTEHNPQKT